VRPDDDEPAARQCGDLRLELIAPRRAVHEEFVDHQIADRSVEGGVHTVGFLILIVPNDHVIACRGDSDAQPTAAAIVQRQFSD
jgi:hypothetical protein